MVWQTPPGDNDPPEVRRAFWEPVILAAAEKYGASPNQMLAVAECESGFKVGAHNTDDPNGGSKGIFQFQRKTFLRYAPLAGILNPEWGDPWQSVEIAAYMFSIRQQSQWTCWGIVTATGMIY